MRRVSPWEVCRELGRKAARTGRSAQSCPYGRGTAYARIWAEERYLERAKVRREKRHVD